MRKIVLFLLFSFLLFPPSFFFSFLSFHIRRFVRRDITIERGRGIVSLENTRIPISSSLHERNDWTRKLEVGDEFIGRDGRWINSEIFVTRDRL